jgi:phosphatidate cytidylyltransferase
MDDGPKKVMSNRSWRLTVGPMLIASLVGLMALDSWVNRQKIPAGMPEFVRSFGDADGTFAAGLILLLAGVLVCGRAGFELSRLFGGMGIFVSAKSLTFCAVAGLLASGLSVGKGAALAEYGGEILATTAGCALFLTMLAYVRDKDVKGAGGAVAAAVMAFVYAGVMLGFLIAIRREHAVWVMVGIVLTIKACDIGAYFTGSAIGRHKLIPWLSPGKTWEGLAGGVVTSALCGVGMALLAEKIRGLNVEGFSWVHGAVLGAILGLMGQAGDLSASVLKRDAGVKDAGRILPGFGGVLDMLDSLLIAGPAAYWFLAIMHR